MYSLSLVEETVKRLKQQGVPGTLEALVKLLPDIISIDTRDKNLSFMVVDKKSTNHFDG